MLPEPELREESGLHAESSEDVDSEEGNKRTQDSQLGPEAEQRLRIRELEADLERYRQASEDALQQLDWCIGYLHGTGRVSISRAIGHNRAFIRSHLLKRSAQPLPSQQTEEEESPPQQLEP